MGMDFLKSDDDDPEEEVYIGEPEQQKEDKNSREPSLSSSTKNENKESRSTLETELEDKLVGSGQKKSQDDSNDENVGLEDVYSQNEEIISLLEKINNKISETNNGYEQ